MDIRPSTLNRLRAREALDRARTDAVELVDSAARRLAPSGSLQSRVATSVERMRPQPRHRMLPLLETFAQLRPRARFVQIGSHDGQQQDPLREIVLANEWSGVMVEPVPYVYARLQHHYGHLRRLALENVAVGPENGRKPFYHLRQVADAGRPGLPIWFDALGSFKRDVVLAHQRFIPDIDERIVEIEVPCLTFGSLCERNGLEHVDVLQTDTEGYDYEILRSVDFERFRPTLIVYESVHLPPADKAACLEHLRGFDYEPYEYELDTWCFNASTLPQPDAEVLVPLWQWLTDPSREPRPLAATRLLRTGGRRLLGARSDDAAAFNGMLALSESERHYLANGYDDREPLPPGAEAHLSRDNPRLRELIDRYARLDLPAVQHHMWTPERISEHVDLRYFRGDNLYLWHRPEHPRAMATVLFIYMRALEGHGGRDLLEQLSEDGAFGCWTAEVTGYGKVSRDLLDSVNEILFLDRQLELLSRPELRVLDIGAGYGRLAHRLATVHRSLADYCCVDAVPESTFLSEYYLDFRGSTPPARVIALDEVQALEPGAFDLAVNIHSFSECTLAAIEWWAQQLARLRVPHLFVVPNEAEGILSREVDGGYHDVLPTLAAAGYHPITVERVLDDPAVRDMVRINDNFYLFALDASPRAAE